MKLKSAVRTAALALMLGSSATAMAMGRGREKEQPVPVPVPSPTAVPTPVAEIQLGVVNAGGSGCLGGAVITEVSFDQLMVRVRFDHYLAEVLDDGSRTMDRKNCGIAIPILKAAEGKRLAVARVAMVGAHELAAESVARASLESFFTGGSSLYSNQELAGSSGGFEVVQTEGGALACGSTGLFRVNSSAFVQNIGSVQVDEVVVFFKLLPCSVE